jgi:hypothetical protein
MGDFAIARTRALGLSWFVASWLLLACGSDDETPNDAGTGGTGGVTGTGGGAGTGGASGTGGSGTGGSGGGATGGSSGVGGTGGTAGSDGGLPGKPFEPEGITHENVGQGPIGLELVAYTLVPGSASAAASGELLAPGDPAWIVAVRNNSDKICNPGIAADFLDSDGNVLATTPATVLSGPMYTVRDDLPLTPCIEGLGTVNTAMGEITLGLTGLDVSQVAKIEYSFVGEVTVNGGRIVGVDIEDVVVTESAGQSRATGRLANGVPRPITDLGVALYAVDPAGRPYGVMTASADVRINPGESWDFQTLPFDGVVEDYVAYAAFDWFPL